MQNILVVEDFQPFREFVCTTVRAALPAANVCETADGLEAVSLARELRFDLITLDIGLPGLNGLQVARRILTFAPQSRILFVSQDSSREVIREALCLGPAGYVRKTDAGKELALAVAAAVRNTVFVSTTYHDA